MLPIAPLMIEHRIIERMIAIMKHELEQIRKTHAINPIFIDTVVDFIRVYADKTHHGKEEEILFRDLKKKELSPEHTKIMEELIEEHKISRNTTAALVAAKEQYQAGNINSLSTIMEKLEFLVGFYPVHIAKEDKQFFVPIMKYFTEPEQQAMLEEGQIFDRKMIHIKYEMLVKNIEQTRGIEGKAMHPNWLSFI
jgi:hemerythrin-like domain-containing protein